MIVELGPLPYSWALELLKWCFEKDVSRAHAEKLILAFSTTGGTKNLTDSDWQLDVPDKYMTYFLLKWSGQGL